MNSLEVALKNYYDNSTAKMTKDQYFLMMEQLGSEPIQEEIPVSFEDFPFMIQQAINIFSILPDVWDGFSGTYLGKDYSILPYLIEEVFEIDDRHFLMKILLIIGNIVSTRRAQEQKNRERQAKAKKGK